MLWNPKWMWKGELYTQACLKDTDDHRNRQGNPPHLCILLHDLFDATLRGGKHSLQIKKM